jgi:adenosylcobinamide-GDP ribazoletransferase
MVLAPLVGALLALVAGVFLWLLGWGPPGRPPLLPDVLGNRAHDLQLHPFLAAALVVGLLAVLTRAMHLDGLADTADGLGSGKPPAEALEIMRRGDVGPFGVVTLVLTLLLQVLALGVLVADGLGLPALLLALVVSRLALALVCSRGVPPARADGLGHVVAGTVGRGQLALASLLGIGLIVALSLVALGPDALTGGVVARAALVALVGLLLAGVVTRRAVRRLGGVTGDVLGAAVEVTFTTVLVVLTIAVR